MDEKKIRLLKAGEIECRIGTIKGNGLSLLLYKDARADMKILDEVFGVTNWQRKHEMIGGSLYCTVSIWDEGKEQWIEKSDVGTESYTEKEKGQASDSFKRACVSLGIGRELYTAPFIWIPEGRANIQQNNGKFYCNDRFVIVRIGYNGDREISELVIVNSNTGAVVYELADRAKQQMKENHAEKVGGVVHCYSYSVELAREFVKMGFYIGIGGVLTFKNARKLVEVAREIPLERLLLETDCPYLAPVPYRGKRNCSLYLPHVVAKLAELKGITEEEVIRVTEHNAETMYRLN